jgi:LPXTG-motif cell wall-anchored protein
VRTGLKLAVLGALLVLVLTFGASVAGAQTTDPCYPDPTAPACIAAQNAGASQSTGLPRTGSSNSIPTAAIAAGMVGVGTVLAVAARRRSTARRTLN